MMTQKKSTSKWIAIIINTILLLLCSYWLGNISIPFSGDETDFLKIYHEVVKSDTNNSDAWKDSILFVNTCYDIDIHPHYTYNSKDGYEARTNRAHLYSVLKALKENDTYRYILIDIRLDRLDNVDDVYTDSIVQLLSDMKRVCVAKSHEFQLADSTLDSIAGWVDYRVNSRETGFAKFDLFPNDEVSMPLRMYQELHNRKLTRKCGIYFDNHTPCHCVFIPTYDITDLTPSINPEDSSQLNYRYTNLNDLLYGEEYGYHNEVKGKIIVFGDLFRHDLHDTYLNKRISGPLINTNIYLSLCNSEHHVHWRGVIMLGVLYLFLFWIMIYFEEKKNKILSFGNAGIIKLVCALFGWGGLFWCIGILMYTIDDIVYNPLIPTLWFTIILPIYLYFAYNFRKNEKV